MQAKDLVFEPGNQFKILEVEMTLDRVLYIFRVRASLPDAPVVTSEAYQSIPFIFVNLVIYLPLAIRFVYVSGQGISIVIIHAAPVGCLLSKPLTSPTIDIWKIFCIGLVGRLWIFLLSSLY